MLFGTNCGGKKPLFPGPRTDPRPSLRRARTRHSAQPGGTGPGMNPDADHQVCVPPALEDEMGTALPPSPTLDLWRVCFPPWLVSQP